MPKSSGLGDNLWIDEFDMSGDANSVDRIACPIVTQEVPGIKQFAQDRIALLHDGIIDFKSWFNVDATESAEGAHVILKGRPTTDRIVTYTHLTDIGSYAASLVSKQVTYDMTREPSGAMSWAINTQGNKYGLEWGQLLTAGLRDDTAATNGASLDFGASISLGWAAYLHMQAFDGTDITVTIQDSADNSNWATLSGAVFTQLTDRGKERIASSSATATVRRYVRAITSGTFTSALFGVNFIRYEAARS